MSLNKRVQLAWTAYRELTISPTAQDIAKVIRKIKRSRQIAANEARREAWLRKRAEIAEQREIAVARGLNNYQFWQVRNLVLRGAALKDAINKIVNKPAKEIQRVWAERAGLSLNTVRARVYHYGWTWERALSEPPLHIQPRKNLDSVMSPVT